MALESCKCGASFGCRRNQSPLNDRYLLWVHKIIVIYMIDDSMLFIVSSPAATAYVFWEKHKRFKLVYHSIAACARMCVSRLGWCICNLFHFYVPFLKIWYKRWHQLCCPPTVPFIGYQVWVGKAFGTLTYLYLILCLRRGGVIPMFPYMPSYCRLGEICLNLNLLLTIWCEDTFAMWRLKSALCTVCVEGDFMRWRSVMWFWLYCHHVTVSRQVSPSAVSFVD